MTEVYIYETGQKAEIPSSWDEMNPRQVLETFRLYEAVMLKGGTLLEFNVRVLYMLLGLKPSRRMMRKLRRNGFRRERFSENVYTLCDSCLGFLFENEDTGDGVKFAYTSVVNSLPEVRGLIFGHPLIGPADLLQDLSFGEFRHAATALNAFFRSRNVQDLDECIAHLYRRRSRKPNRCGRYVADVDSVSFEKDVRRVSRMKSWQKNYIMTWFAACLNYLQNDTVVIDGESINMSLMFSGDGASSSAETSFTWNDLLVQIARDQTVGNIERVDQEPLFSVFSLMWTNYKENKRHERDSKTKQGK